MVIERQNRDGFVENEQAREAIAQFFAQNDYTGKRILVIIPDNTRSGPIGDMFKLIYEFLGPKAKAVDCLTALGTHHAMSEEQICTRLSMTLDERKSRYSAVKFFNHEWD
ncbi:MAG: lactate racemase domain-containing protein, partial [Planctomycetota bacterium]